MSMRKDKAKKKRHDDRNLWNEYMTSKQGKLINQFKCDVKALKISNGQESSIFKDVSIFINGYTSPPADDLKQLMILHGGTYRQYYHKSNTTHIIASNLSTATLKNLRSEKVVRPQWITDSINAGELLPYHLYLLSGENEKQSILHVCKKSKPPNQETVTHDLEKTDSTRSLPYSHEPCASIASLDDISTNNSVTSKSGMHIKSLEADLSSDKKVYRDAMCATNSKFLSEFYNNSRLHLISTMGAQFKEYVTKLQDKSDVNFPGRERLKKKLQQTPYLEKNTSSEFPDKNNKAIFMHIDMDCFFVSVGLRKKPELKGKPVAVAHSKGIGTGKINNAALWQFEKSYYGKNTCKVATKVQDCISEDETEGNLLENEGDNQNDERKKTTSTNHAEKDGFKSTSEIASCNYEARAAGLHNGMFLGEALELCPELQIIPYDFSGYQEVAFTLYDVIASYTNAIEAVSCDELYADCSAILEHVPCNPIVMASIIREEIEEKTSCTCSAGLASNMLLARLATKKAKPNGQYYVDPESSLSFVGQFFIRDLPGVGASTSRKLNALGVTTCKDLQNLSLQTLQTELGSKTGQTLFNFCRGADNRSITREHIRKSVSAEVNYGIRFTLQEEVTKFLTELSEELSKRLKELGMKGRTLSLKLKVRKKEAPKETAKFMGHGICDNLGRSVSILSPTDDPKIIKNEVEVLFRQLNIVPSDIRGIGIQMQRLESNVKTNDGRGLLSFLKTSDDVTCEPSSSRANTSRISNQYSLPNLSQIDQEVLQSLPQEIQEEINNAYKRKKTEIIDERVSKAKIVKSSPKRKISPTKKRSPIKRKKPVIKNQTIHAKQIPVVNKETEEPSGERIPSKCNKQKADLCGAQSLDDVRQLFNEWLSNCTVPQAEDTRTVSCYLKSLILERNLEQVDLIIRYFNRLIKEIQNDAWEKCYTAIIKEVQGLMINLYGAPLKIP